MARVIMNVMDAPSCIRGAVQDQAGAEEPGRDTVGGRGTSPCPGSVTLLSSEKAPFLATELA